MSENNAMPYEGANAYGWICPKCGSVLAPWVWQCDRCNATRNVPFVSATGTNADSIQFPQTTYESLFRTENVSPDRIAQPEVHIDPNTQCVDCRYGCLVYTPDGLDCSVKCDLFGVIRTIQDTCVQQRVDIRDMKVTKGDE